MADAVDELWRLEPHCCRICFGRLVSRHRPDGHRLIRCTNCGMEVENARVSALCCCGMQMRTGRNAGLRCIVNPRRAPEFPSEIIAQAAEAPAGIGAHEAIAEGDDDGA